MNRRAGPRDDLASRLLSAGVRWRAVERLDVHFAFTRWLSLTGRVLAVANGAHVRKCQRRTVNG